MQFKEKIIKKKTKKKANLAHSGEGKHKRATANKKPRVPEQTELRNHAGVDRRLCQNKQL